MSDYTPITDFSVKDGLTTGDPEKLILGADFDAEFDAINTAVASKYDSDDIASEAQAEALTLDTVLITPLQLDNVFKDNAGILSNLQALADPGADRLFGWDATTTDAIGFTLGSGLDFSGTTIVVDDSDIDHDDLTNFVANEHINHTSVSITAGTGMTGGGTIASTRTLNVIGGDGITANANDVALTNVSAGGNNPVNIAAGVFTFDITALAALADGSDLADTDSVIVDNGGTARKLLVQNQGMRLKTGADAGTTSQTLAGTDMNSIMVWTGTATLTLPNSDLSIGAPVVLKNTHASQDVTVTADTGATLDTVNHPGGAEDSDTIKPGGTALIYQTASGVWHMGGDIED